MIVSSNEFPRKAKLRNRFLLRHLHFIGAKRFMLLTSEKKQRGLFRALITHPYVRLVGSWSSISPSWDLTERALRDRGRSSLGSAGILHHRRRVEPQACTELHENAFRQLTVQFLTTWRLLLTDLIGTADATAFTSSEMVYNIRSNNHHKKKSKLQNFLTDLILQASTSLEEHAYRELAWMNPNGTRQLWQWGCVSDDTSENWHRTGLILGFVQGEREGELVRASFELPFRTLAVHAVLVAVAHCSLLHFSKLYPWVNCHTWLEARKTVLQVIFAMNEFLFDSVSVWFLNALFYDALISVLCILDRSFLRSFTSVHASESLSLMLQGTFCY